MIVGFYRAVKTTTFVITQHEPSHRLLVYALDSVLPLSVVTNGTELLFLVGDLFFFPPATASWEVLRHVATKNNQRVTSLRRHTKTPAAHTHRVQCYISM